MAQLVFEFVSHDLKAVAGAVQRLIELREYACEAAREFLRYEPYDSFESGLAALHERDAMSVVLRPRDKSDIRYVLINEPQFNGTKLPYWFGTIETTNPDYLSLWNGLLAQDGLAIACLGSEEGVTLDNVEQLTLEQFPWEDECLVIGALRVDEQRWHIQNGPRYFCPDCTSSWASANPTIVYDRSRYH